MDNPTGLFKFSRAGKVIHEGIPYDQAVRLITDGAILPSDFYWVAGMADWQLVSSRVWIPSSSPKSPPPPLPHVDEDLNEKDALMSLQGILTAGEKVLYYAIQRRLFAIFSRRILIAATNGRVIVITRGLFGGFTMQDYRWQDIADSKISTGIFGADLVKPKSSPGGRSFGFVRLKRCVLGLEESTLAQLLRRLQPGLPFRAVWPRLNRCLPMA